MSIRHVTIALALMAGSFTANAQIPVPASITDRSARLVVAASELRLLLSSSTRLALRPLSAAEAAILTRAMNLTDPVADSLWSQAIGPATQFARLSGDTAETAWWNPLIDAGLALRWQYSGGSWRVQAAAPFAGDTVRVATIPPDSDLGSRWRRRFLAMRQAVQAGQLSAAVAHPLAPLQLMRLSAEAGASVGAARPSVQAQRIVAGRALLIHGHPGGAGGRRLAVDLAGLSDEARLGLAPQSRIDEPDSESVVWVSPGAPDTLFILRYPRSLPGAVVPASVEAVDLIVRPGEQP